MKKFEMPILSVSRFGEVNIITTSEPAHTNITGKQTAVQRDFWEVKKSALSEIGIIY